MEKKFFFKIIGIIVAVVTAMAGIVIWIDPFYHYHKPLSYISYVSGADVYSNDGKLKHFDYDTLTIGTSMAMNFRKEKVDTILGGNSLNVYYLGEGFKVINEGLETALETHPDLKLVVRTVDTTWFVSAVNWEGRESYPEYLYDKNPFNDVYYIYNKDVWKDNLIPSIVQSFKNGFQGEVKQEGFGSRGLTGKENVLKNIDKIDIKLVSENSVTKVYLNGADVSDKIRENIVSITTPKISIYKPVREYMLNKQRQYALNSSIVMDGRDIGTVVFPNANLKIYLIASYEQRAIIGGLRSGMGYCGAKDIETLKEELKKRDIEDMTREISPLKKADDAVEIDTTGNTLEETLNIVMNIINE